MVKRDPPEHKFICSGHPFVIEGAKLISLMAASTFQKMLKLWNSEHNLLAFLLGGVGVGNKWLGSIAHFGYFVK